jgi:integrase
MMSPNPISPRAAGTAGGADNREEALMSTVSSQTLRSKARRDERDHVVWRGQRVPNLWTRPLADGSLAYEFQGRIAGGKPIRRRLRATTAGEALRESRRLVAELERSGAAPASASMTVAEAAERWGAYLDSFVVSGELAERTVALHKQRLRSRIVPLLGRHRLAKLTTGHVSGMMEQLRSARKPNGKPLGGTTRHGYLATLENLLRWAVEQHLIARSPADDLPRRERPSAARVRQPRRLNSKQVEALLDHLGEQFKSIGYVLAFQALRVSEALGLRWCDIDFKARKLSVSGQLAPGGRRVDRTKTSASAATIDLLPTVARELRAWRAQQAERDLNLVRPEALVFTTLNGLPQSRRNVHRAIVNAAKAAGLHADPSLPKVCPHDLRGSAGSIALPLLANDLSRVSKFLRHANSNVTSRLYVDVLEGDAKIGDDLARAGFGA